MTLQRRSLRSAPAVLNPGDKAMWVTGWNEAVDALEADQAQAVEPATGERAELIAHHRRIERTSRWGSLKAIAKATADMLEADAQELTTAYELVNQWSVKYLDVRNKLLPYQLMQAQQVAVPATGEPEEMSDGEIYSRISRRVAEINATFVPKQIAPMTMEDIVTAAGAQHIDVYAASFMCGIRAAEAHYKVKKAQQVAGFQCEPQPAVTEDGFCEWVCPTPIGYLMQCCDCGLIHEVETRVVKYDPRPSENFALTDDHDLQVQLRMKRRDDLAPQPIQGDKP